jgi:hypothetical protein
MQPKSATTRKCGGKLLAALVLLSVAASHAPAVSQGGRWRGVSGRPLVKFNWGCASPSVYPARRLGARVRATMRREGFEGFGTWGDRAFAFDLNGDGRPEYFVPLDCGGVGNCTWGVFGLRPSRELGLLVGQHIYVHRRAGRWPDIIVYAHFSAAEGGLRTYGFRNGRYAQVGDVYTTDVRGGVYGNKVPQFLDGARAACDDAGL